MAWENGDWYDEESFLNYQKKWAIAGIITMVVTLLIATGGIYTSIQEKKQEIKRVDEIVEYIKADDTVKKIIGEDFQIKPLGETFWVDVEKAYSLILIMDSNVYWATAYYLDNGLLDKIEIENDNHEILVIIFPD